MHMWQMGRKTPMRFYGIPHCINRVEETMEMYGWEYWPNFFPVSFSRIGSHDNTLLLKQGFCNPFLPCGAFYSDNRHAHHQQAQRQSPGLQL